MLFDLVGFGSIGELPGVSWKLHGASWGLPEASCILLERPGASWGLLWTLGSLGLPGKLLGASWGLLKRPGASWGFLGLMEPPGAS